MPLLHVEPLLHGVPSPAPIGRASHMPVEALQRCVGLQFASVRQPGVVAVHEGLEPTTRTH
jgi:hypothetical protein